MNSTRRTVLLLLAAAVLVAGCNSAWFRRASNVAGQEAAYAALAGYLTRAGVRSAGNFVDAVRLVVTSRDYPRAAAAFAVALADHNAATADKLTSPQVIALLRQAQPVVNRASRRVGSSLAGFCDYLATH